MITELILQDFRGFRSLELSGLKRVNLIVGRNSSGKTSLLEAIVLLCGSPHFGDLPTAFRPSQGDPDVRYFSWLLRDRTSGGHGSIRYNTTRGSNTIVFGDPKVIAAAKPSHSQHLYGGSRLAVWRDSKGVTLRCRIIPVQHRDANTLVSFVGSVQRKKGLETLERLLAVVDPHITAIRVDPGADGNQVIVDIGLSEMVPLSQAGQGVFRLMTILSDIIGESPEVLAIDEIENGLHHSVHEQVWRGLAEIASQLNVQIFATTHSGECLQAAHSAFSKRTEFDLGVIQLFRVESGVQGRVLDRKHIEAALAGEIELRD